jgi:hypothetical protein
MGAFLVDSVVRGELDSTGAAIEEVYSKVSGRYAVYGTADRVVVQYADDDAVLGPEQRQAFRSLNPLRGDINGLIDGWRRDTRKDSYVRRIDRRTADALGVALQGDPAQAESLLKSIHQEIVGERTSIGRAEYIEVATGTAIAVLIVLIIVLAIASGRSWAIFVDDNRLLLGLGLGFLGALFSIALGIRNREIKTDLERRDNIVDAILRILIGGVSATILFSLFNSGFFDLKIGGKDLNLANPGPEFTHTAIVVAFLAGFSERLVGNFLLGTTLLGGTSATAQAEAAAKEEKPAPVRAEATEMNPLGKSLAESPARRSLIAAFDADPDIDADETRHLHEHAEDNCACSVGILAEETTTDAELPEATGGVEKAA